MRYDPRNPGDAVIDPHIPWSWGAALVLSAAFVLLGLAGLVLLSLS